MAKKDQSATPNRFGRGLFLAGCAALLVDASILAFEFGRLLEQSGEKALGFAAALGLAMLRVSQSVAFDHGSGFAIVSRFLLLFCPILVMAAGALLVRMQPRAGEMDSMSYGENNHGEGSRP
jgi:hypothetical protein